jgi:putative addiction module component (TIGR02574 family)
MHPTALSIKEKLHQTIECIDDEKVLEAFYTILESFKNEAEGYELTDEQSKELERREADHLAGKTKSYSVEEFEKIMNQKYGY